MAGGSDPQIEGSQEQRARDQAVRAGLEAIKREHPEWNIAFIGGRRARWMAGCVFEAPSAYVYVECFSLQALRARMIANDWVVTPKFPLSAMSQDAQQASESLTPSRHRRPGRDPAGCANACPVNDALPPRGVESTVWPAAGERTAKEAARWYG